MMARAHVPKEKEDLISKPSLLGGDHRVHGSATARKGASSRNFTIRGRFRCFFDSWISLGSVARSQCEEKKKGGPKKEIGCYRMTSLP